VKILVVEDDPRIADLLRRGLGEEGHIVVVAPDLATARIAVGTEAPDLITLDRALPDGDGLELVRALRRRGELTPVLVLTAKDRVEERVAGLLEGADDYLVKPFALDELLARITALARRASLGAGRITIDDLVLDTEALRVFRGGVEVRLTAQEFKLLRYLAEHRGRVVSRTRLLEQVWDTQHDPGTNIVDVYVSYVRAKIDRGHRTPLLHTVRGMGFVLEARA
jgi:DNA-binding response OmpR family regulator